MQINIQPILLAILKKATDQSKRPKLFPSSTRTIRIKEHNFSLGKNVKKRCKKYCKKILFNQS